MNFDPKDLLNNVKNMQGHFKEMQGKLASISADGVSGGGLVKITIDGELRVKSVLIDPIAVDPRDVTMLEDLIQAAFNSAQDKIKDKLKEEMGNGTGMDFPFDLKGLI